eukprot:CAMPEP_0206230820 /NCGR_PEP_ID=MMETSP0047_2-20121206/10484_1 /ASSEMBLY_ACC=CAM_ASM_000192 /TAXON_ID=195065 /ORGANISM="Chroomonas mesostigmatica_cf, Strain CCMP1168" /LENGTH=413 /DNA_ID=CAMNT_0053654311 /DNA_START=59 /DNA_END=1296 /DNA_ORIENTATION=+
MARVVRTSKFRHVHGSVSKDKYDNINSTATAADSNIIAGNSKYLALPWQGGGGPFVVHNLSVFGRLEAIPKMFQGHSGTVQDLDFCPFKDEVIASASEDASVKVWDFSSYLEDGAIKLTEDVPNDKSVTLAGHTKKVTLVRWNPVAADTLLSVSYDTSVRIWDVSKQAEACCFSDLDDVVQHVAWNYDGSKYVVTSKDKAVRLVDPRASSVAMKFSGHEGSKGARVTFLGKRDIFATIGFSKQSERQLYFWDQRDGTKPVHTETIDVASGTVLPFYDDDTSILYLGGKGDCNIRYFEMVDGAPHSYYIDQYTGKDAQRGLCLLPKLACEVEKAEIARVLRLCDKHVEPVSFQVPRKADVFHEDLYPPTFSGEPSLSSDEWLAGANKDPLLRSLDPSGLGDITTPVPPKSPEAT